MISNPLTLRVSQLKVRIKYAYDLRDIIRMNSTRGNRRKRTSKDDGKNIPKRLKLSGSNRVRIRSVHS
ncbi:Uncharacterised protein [Raoultella terrigena]|uniref:Uncharacterized protein n=1 Tax=Raoultella terrigena TaxID=577 RepID=A0A485B236_RAOTE|nr:Uncharacterised protein [Raoultella terrigena]